MALSATFPAYSQQPSQQAMAAVLYGSAADVIAAVSFTVTTAADTDGPSLLVVGVNSFMAIFTCSASAGTLTFSWLHMDPTTGAVIAVRQVATAIPSGQDNLLAFGAFGGSAPAMNGDVFHTGKVRLRAAVANVTISAFRLWAGKR